MDTKLIELQLLGNLLIDEQLEHNLLTDDDFNFDDHRKLYNYIKELKDDGKPLSTVYGDVRYYNLVSEATDHGIITTAYTHNVDTLKRLNVCEELKRIGGKLSSTDYRQLDSAVKTIENALDSYNDLTHSDTDKVYNPDKKPYGGKDTIGAYIPTGFDTLDEASNDLPTRQVSLVTGRSFEGKTTFVRQVIANAIDKNYKVLWVMGENYIQNELERLYEFVIGTDDRKYVTVQRNKKYKKIPNKETLNALSKWHRNKLRIIHKSESGLKTTDQLFDLVKSEIKNHRPQLVVLDNLMSLLSAKAVEKYEKQGEFVQNCCDLSKTEDCHMMIVLHPSKSYQKGMNLEYEHISGTMDIPNKADLIYVVRKNHKKEEDECDGYIDIIKNKVEDTTVSIRTFFDRSINGLCELGSDNRPIRWGIDISKYYDVTLKMWNGTEQTFENGEFDSMPF